MCVEPYLVLFMNTTHLSQGGLKEVFERSIWDPEVNPELRKEALHGDSRRTY